MPPPDARDERFARMRAAAPGREQTRSRTHSTPPCPVPRARLFSLNIGGKRPYRAGHFHFIEVNRGVLLIILTQDKPRLFY
jgi:hypothetical protein